MRPSFSSSMVSQVVGVSLRQLDYWARTGLLKPSGVEATGKGSRRSYTFRDIVALMAIRDLRQGNCPLQKVRAAVRHLRRHNPELNSSELLARLTLLTDGMRVYVLTDSDEIMEVVSRQMVWSVPLGKLVQEARSKVEELPPQWVEVMKCERQCFHLEFLWDQNGRRYGVTCRELPGVKHSGSDASAIGEVIRDEIRRLVGEHPANSISVGTAAS